MVSVVGGVLGVLFTIPLRRALIDEPSLRFPEGVATAEVLKVGAQSDGASPGALRSLMVAAAAGGAMKLAESGLRLWSDFRQNAIDVLHHFPLLEEIRFLDAHGFADQFKKVDYLERRSALVGA